MNEFDAAFYNHALIRFCSNCYRFSVRDTYGINYSAGISPGGLRARKPDNWRNLHSIIANCITDGLQPLWLAEFIGDRIGSFVPVAPKGHYLIVATVSSRDFHFIKIDESMPDNNFLCSYRSESWDGNPDTGDKRAFAKTEVASWTDLTTNNEEGFVFGIFACPNKGLDLSMGKVVHDIKEKCGTKYFNGLNPKFIDKELEFYHGYKNLKSSGFVSAQDVNTNLRAYHMVYDNYFNSPIKSGAKNGMITDAINQIYRKTPLAKEDAMRVRNLFVRNLSWSAKLYGKLCKLY
jgi:hypothetical protein